MKKSVNLYFNNSKLEKEKLMAIKAIGFDEFFTDIYDEGEDLDLSEQCEYGRNLGMECTMIHCLYNEPVLHYFWEEGEEGDKICLDYCSQIKRAKGLTKNFVVHLNAAKTQQQSRFGLQRIRKMLQICEECDMNLCIENLYSDTEIPYVFKHIKHKNLKICFDVGHKNFLTPKFELLKEYYQFVEVLHLHDNHGQKDEHLVCGKGNIDWQSFAKELSVIPDIVLSAEVRNDTSNNIQFLTEVYAGLKLIEEFVEQ